MKTALELLVFGSIAILIHAFGFFYAPDHGAIVDDGCDGC